MQNMRLTISGLPDYDTSMLRDILMNLLITFGASRYSRTLPPSMHLTLMFSCRFIPSKPPPPQKKTPRDEVTLSRPNAEHLR